MLRRSMAVILWLLAHLVGCAPLSVQAPDGTQIPDGASAVLVSGVSLDEARTSLVRQGWTIADFDVEAGILRTEPWTEDDGLNPVRITINAMPDSALVVRGQWAYGRYSRIANQALVGRTDQLDGWSAAVWNDNGNARQALLHVWRAATNFGGVVDVQR